MRQILAAPQRHVLAHFTAANVLVAFDYDGTLAPIRPNPVDVRMRPSTKRLLSSIARRYPTVVISGRARDDAIRQLKGVDVDDIAGNHGIEPWGARREYADQVTVWRQKLEAEFVGWPGVVIENKTYTLTVHYRRARSRRRAAARIQQVTSELRGARRVDGKYAFNLIPRTAPTKGDALLMLRRVFACDAAIYVGDDATDEDVFRRTDGTTLSIRVGHTPRSHATHFLRGQAEVDALLQALVDLRPLSRAPSSRAGQGGRAAVSSRRKYRPS